MLGPRSFTAQMTRSIEALVCADPVLRDLPPEQLAALHAMKFEVLAAVHRASMHVSAEVVDRLIKKVFEDASSSARLTE